MPDHLWAAHKYDVGLIKGQQPIHITPKNNYRPHERQYTLKPEAVNGIRPVFKSLLQAGVIIPCNDSPVRTPIFPVKKIRDRGQPDEWRFVQDLRKVNEAVVPRAPIVPNPYTILSQIPSGSTCFTVIDLANAFFSVPVHKDSQFWFAFAFDGKTYTFTRLCQGYCESPTIFHQALNESLQALELHPQCALLQYVDDLLLAAPNADLCKAESLKLLIFLSENGHKVSKPKMQFVLPSVTFLGHVISQEGRKLSNKRVEAIISLPLPLTKKQLMSFLGLCGYCRHFIPSYSELERPLRDICHEKGLLMSSKVTWTDKALTAFKELKIQLQKAPTLGIPDPTRPLYRLWMSVEAV